MGKMSAEGADDGSYQAPKQENCALIDMAVGHGGLTAEQTLVCSVVFFATGDTATKAT